MTTNANGLTAPHDQPVKNTLNHADDSTAETTKSVAHAARTMSGTCHFCTETARVQQQTDAEWIAEYDAADPLAKHPVSGIVGAGALNTQEVADNRPVSAVSFRPEFADTAQCRIRGYGWDGVKRKPTRTATSVFRTSCPPFARLKAFGGNQSQVGAKAMNGNIQTTGQTAPIHTHDHHQTDLFFQASNHLSLALHSLRNATGDLAIKTAAGRANAAARALNQLAGGAHHV